MSKKIYYSNYQDYLKSDKWEEVRADHLNKTKCQDCSFCLSSEDIQYHHWRYESNWNNDSYKNILPVCGSCHKNIHNHNPEESWNEKDNSLENLKLYISTVKFNMGQSQGSEITYKDLQRSREIMRGRLDV